MIDHSGPIKVIRLSHQDLAIRDSECLTEMLARRRYNPSEQEHKSA
jgi:hypothetical protein